MDDVDPIEIMARAIQEAPYRNPEFRTWDQVAGYMRKQRLCEARLAAEALDAAGFAIVPKEPTREMWAAGGDACVTLGNVHHDRITGDVWTAMVAAGALKP